MLRCRVIVGATTPDYGMRRGSLRGGIDIYPLHEHVLGLSRGAAGADRESRVISTWSRDDCFFCVITLQTVPWKHTHILFYLHTNPAVDNTHPNRVHSSSSLIKFVYNSVQPASCCRIDSRPRSGAWSEGPHRRSRSSPTRAVQRLDDIHTVAHWPMPEARPHNVYEI